MLPIIYDSMVGWPDHSSDVWLNVEPALHVQTVASCDCV